MKIIVIIFVLALVLISGCATQTINKPYEGKKILWVDSYNKGYEWSDEIQEGIVNILKDDVELKIQRMDTKQNQSEEYLAQAALDAKSAIESFNPDAVIVSDDNAFKYIVMEHYKGAELPFVYCGLNWDSSVYGAPYSNTAGMIEVTPIALLIEEMKKYSKGDKIGFLSIDTITARKEAENYKKVLGKELTEEYSLSFAEWKQDFIGIQKKVDMLILYNNAGVNDWDDAEARQWAEKNTVIITGAVMDWMAPFAAITLDHSGIEQGEYAAKTALRILNGENPSDIPEEQNKQSQLTLQMEISNNLGIVFDLDMLQKADKIIK